MEWFNSHIWPLLHTFYFQFSKNVVFTDRFQLAHHAPSRYGIVHTTGYFPAQERKNHETGII